MPYNVIVVLACGCRKAFFHKNQARCVTSTKFSMGILKRAVSCDVLSYNYYISFWMVGKRMYVTMLRNRILPTRVKCSTAEDSSTAKHLYGVLVKSTQTATWIFQHGGHFLRWPTFPTKWMFKVRFTHRNACVCSIWVILISTCIWVYKHAELIYTT